MKKIISGVCLFLAVQCMGESIEYVKVSITNSTQIEYIEISGNQRASLLMCDEYPYTKPLFDIGNLGVSIELEIRDSQYYAELDGPGTIKVSASSSLAPLNFVFKIITKDGSLTPASTIVIPSDHKGPVIIKLECSSDMINWTDATPGTYQTGASNRFFRIKGIREEI